VCVLDTIYGLVTKKIAVGKLRKIIVTPKEDNLGLGKQNISACMFHSV
jgi:hypothetical protein